MNIFWIFTRICLIPSIFFSGPAFAREDSSFAESAVTSRARVPRVVARVGKFLPSIDLRGVPLINEELVRTQTRNPNAFLREIKTSSYLLVAVVVLQSANEIARDENFRLADLNIDALLVYLTSVTSQLLNSKLPEQLVVGIAAGSAAQRAVSEALTSLYKDALHSPSYVKHVAMSAAVLAGMWGMEYVDQLITEGAWASAEQTGNPDDFQRAQHPLSVLAGSARFLMKSNSQSSQPSDAASMQATRDRADAKLASIMLVNTLYRIFAADTLRNTWRLHLKGETIIFTGLALAAYGAASAIGSGTAPFTIGALVVFYLIPEDVKKQLTRRVQTARMWANGQRLYVNATELSRPGPVSRLSYGYSSGSGSKTERLLVERSRIRDDLATAAYEKVRNALNGLTEPHSQKSTAHAAILAARQEITYWLDQDIIQLKQASEQLTRFKQRRPELDISTTNIDAQANIANEAKLFIIEVFQQADAAVEMTNEQRSTDDMKTILRSIEVAYQRGMSATELGVAAIADAAEHPQ